MLKHCLSTSLRIYGRALLLFIALLMMAYLTLIKVWSNLEEERWQWSNFTQTNLFESNSRCLQAIRHAKVDYSWVCSEEELFEPDWFESRFDEEEKKGMSNLGRHLFLNEELKRKNREFLILFWKYGPNVEARYLRSYTENNTDPFASDKCPVQNCRLSYNESELEDADAILFHLHRIAGPHDMPETRKKGQRWVFITDESPHHTFYSYKLRNLSHFDRKFNWSMAYRSDTDVPVPYGRTVLLQNSESPAQNWPEKRRMAAILGSNSGGTSRRWNYVQQLSEYIPVDLWGGAGRHRCPGHFKRDCSGIDFYRFYLAFENAVCNEYITEKPWWNAYLKHSVPIMIGGLSRGDYERLVPPKSFVHVDDFESPKKLAQFLLFLERSPRSYARFHLWRKHYDVRNEHGYFGAETKHYCHLCMALNANEEEPKVYNDLASFWGIERDCRNNIEYIRTDGMMEEEE